MRDQRIAVGRALPHHSRRTEGNGHALRLSCEKLLYYFGCSVRIGDRTTGKARGFVSIWFYKVRRGLESKPQRFTARIKQRSTAVQVGHSNEFGIQIRWCSRR